MFERRSRTGRRSGSSPLPSPCDFECLSALYLETGGECWRTNWGWPFAKPRRGSPRPTDRRVGQAMASPNWVGHTLTHTVQEDMQPVGEAVSASAIKVTTGIGTERGDCRSDRTKTIATKHLASRDKARGRREGNPFAVTPLTGAHRERHTVSPCNPFDPTTSLVASTTSAPELQEERPLSSVTPGATCPDTSARLTNASSITLAIGPSPSSMSAKTVTTTSSDMACRRSPEAGDATAGWFGVSVNGAGRVTELKQADSGLIGCIPSALDRMSMLRYLHLGRNSLRGGFRGRG